MPPLPGANAGIAMFKEIYERLAKLEARRYTVPDASDPDLPLVFRSTGLAANTNLVGAVTVTLLTLLLDVAGSWRVDGVIDASMPGGSVTLVARLTKTGGGRIINTTDGIEAPVDAERTGAVCMGYIESDGNTIVNLTGINTGGGTIGAFGGNTRLLAARVGAAPE